MLVKRFAVVAWHENPRYYAHEAIENKLYKLGSATNKKANKLNELPYSQSAPRGYVVRPVEFEDGKNS